MIMNMELDTCFILLNQTFALAEYLSLDIFVGIEMPSNRRFWSSNGKKLQFDFMSNELGFQENDLWLKPGKINGEAVVDKDKLFNMMTDGLTNIRRDQAELSTVVDTPTIKIKEHGFSQSTGTDSNLDVASNLENPHDNAIISTIAGGENNTPEKKCNVKQDARISTKCNKDKNSENGGECGVVSSTSVGDDDENDQSFVSDSDDYFKSGPATQNQTKIDSWRCEKCDEICSNEQNMLQHKKNCQNGSKLNAKPSPNDVSAELENLYKSLKGCRPTVLCKSIHLKCRHCGEIFKTREERLKHFKEMHCTCHLCGKYFQRKRDLRIHIAAIHEKLKYVCPNCGKELTTCKSLKRHEIKCKNEIRPKLKCLRCKETFNSKLEQKNHQRIHNTCTQCGKGFLDGKTLRKHHSAIHLKLKPFECPKCNKRFTQKSTIAIHDLAVHQNNKDRKCSYCGLAFSTGQLLMSHVKRVHLKLKNHLCKQCPMRFMDACRLKVHVAATHQGKKDIDCKLCDKMFARADGLKQHMQFKHLNAKPFACLTCKKRFVTSGHLKRHGLTHT